MNFPYAAGLALLFTDRTQVPGDRTLLDVVAAALEGGAHSVIVRERDLPPAERAALVQSVADLCATRFEVNAPTDHRRAHLKPPMHLSRNDPVPGDVDRAANLVGRSCHDLAELRRAADQGLDYVTISPMTATASKPGYGPALGVVGLRNLVSSLRSERATTPAILALGGVTADNAGYWIEAGADGVAVMGEVMRAADPAATMRAIVESVAAAGEPVR
jgi:thiamine-phosphate pyrophosphorylase